MDSLSKLLRENIGRSIIILDPVDMDKAGSLEKLLPEALVMLNTIELEEAEEPEEPIEEVETKLSGLDDLLDIIKRALENPPPVGSGFIDKDKTKEGLLKAGLKASTINQYGIDIKGYIKSLTGKDIKNPVWSRSYFEDIRQIFNELNRPELSPVWRNSKSSALLTIYRNSEEPNEEILAVLEAMAKYYRKLADDQKQMRTATSKELANQVFIEEVRDVFKKQGQKINPDKIDKLYTQYIIAGLYSYIPPLRPQDYVNLKIDSSDLSENSIDSKDWKLRIVEHKTAKKYGTKSINIPMVLRPILGKYIDLLKKDNIEWLFPQEKDNKNHIDRARFSLLMGQLFKSYGLGDNVSPSILRKSYISEANQFMTGRQLKNLAKTMGHEPATQQVIYTVFNRLPEQSSKE